MKLWKLILVLVLGLGGWKAWQLHVHGPDPMFSAKRAMAMGHYERAVDHLGLALVERPDDEAEIYMRLGLCYDHLGRFDEAVQHYLRASPFYAAYPNNDDTLRAQRRLKRLQGKGH